MILKQIFKTVEKLVVIFLICTAVEAVVPFDPGRQRTPGYI